MFKFTTVVKVGACVSVMLTALVFQIAGAQEAAANRPVCQDTSTLNQQLTDLESATPRNESAITRTTDLLNSANQCVVSQGGGSSISCQNAESKYFDAGKEFTDACAKANLGTGYDATECGRKMAQCDVAQGAGLSNDPNKPYDTSASARAKIQQCPAYAGLDLKTLREQIEQQRKAVSQMEKEVPTLQRDLLSARREANKANADARKEEAENLKNHGKELRDIANSAVEKDKAAQDKLNQIRSEITGKYIEIQQTKQQQIAAGASLEESKAKIRLNCYTTASNQVSEEQKNAIARQSMGSYNRGNQNQLLANVGMSSRQAWQRLATKYYDWCITAQPATESLKSANTAYTLTIGQMDQRVRDLNSAIDILQAQMLQVASPVPCLPGDQSTDVCRAQTARTLDLSQSQEDFQAQQNALGDEMRQTQTDSQQTNALNQETLDHRQKDIEDERTRLTNLQAYYAMKYNASGGRETEQGALAEAFAKYANLQSVAHQVKDCTVDAPQAAQRASDFLRGIGDPDAEPIGRQPEAETPRDSAPIVPPPPECPAGNHACGDDSCCPDTPSDGIDTSI